MNATKEAHKYTPEWFEAWRREKERVVQEVLGEYMERAGIESLEEFYRRSMETDGPQVPAPGRNRGKRMKFPEFREHVEARYPRTYPELMEPLSEVLSLGEEDRQALAFAYVWGERLPEGIKAKA